MFTLRVRLSSNDYLYSRMGTWIAKLAGHEDDAEKVLKDPHSIVAYVLVFGLAFLVLLLFAAIFVVTAIRVYKKYRKQDKNLKVRATDILRVNKCRICVG